MGKTKRQLALDAEKLVIKEGSSIPDQFRSSELQAFEALRRRGIALCFADILSWEKHEQQLTGHLRQEPPPNYTRPSLPQVLKADRQVFLFLILAGIDLKRKPDGALEMDTQIFTALQSYEVGFHLLPMPKASGKAEVQQPSQSTPAPPQQWNSGKGGFQSSRCWQPYKGKGKGSGSSKGQGRKRMGQGLLPRPLLGRDNTSADAHGRRLCFDFQLGKCSAVAEG